VALDNALNLVRPAGWISKVGWGPQPIGFSLDRLVQKNVTLQGSFSHNWPIWERIIRLIASGALDVRPITGGVWPLSKWKDAFETMHSGKIVEGDIKAGLIVAGLFEAGFDARRFNTAGVTDPQLQIMATKDKVILVTGSTTGSARRLRNACLPRAASSCFKAGTWRVAERW